MVLGKWNFFQTIQNKKYNLLDYFLYTLSFVDKHPYPKREDSYHHSLEYNYTTISIPWKYNSLHSLKFLF